MLYIGTSTCSPNTCYQIEYKNTVTIKITIFIFIFNLITCIRTTSRSTDVQHITSLYQIAYVQRIRYIKNSPSNI
jgi:hypothetical protein